MFLTNHSSAFLLHDVRVPKNVACLSSLFCLEIRLYRKIEIYSKHDFETVQDLYRCWTSFSAILTSLFYELVNVNPYSPHAGTMRGLPEV